MAALEVWVFCIGGGIVMVVEPIGVHCPVQKGSNEIWVCYRLVEMGSKARVG